MTLPRDGRDDIDMEGGGEEDMVGLRKRRRKGIFRALLCASRGLGPPPPTRDDIALCRGYIITTHNLSATGAAAAPETSLATSTISGGGRGGDFHKSELSSYPSSVQRYPAMLATRDQRLWRA